MTNATPVRPTVPAARVVRSVDHARDDASLAAPSIAAAQAQSAAIVGRVTDARSGDPVSNATIQIEGTRLAGVAGTDGRYRIANVPAGAHSLVVLRLGYASLRRSSTVAAGQDQTIDFVLQASAVSLDQVVVTGTAGETEKRSIGNAVSTIDASIEMQKASPPDIANLLRSRAPGVDIQPISGRIGAGPSIQIRGPSSIGLSNNPLIYIDGVRVNNATGLGPTGIAGGLGAQGNPVESRMNDINPDDIESIEIIKGPAAATIYGTEAANGVIQIITKKGASQRGQLRTSITAGPMYFRDAEGRVPTNYDKDKSGNIVPWNGVKAMSDSGHSDFQDGVGATLLDGGRRWPGSGALLRVARIRERLRHRAEQPAARLQRAPQSVHAARDHDRRIDEPQLHRYVDASRRGRRCIGVARCQSRDTRCSRSRRRRWDSIRGFRRPFRRRCTTTRRDSTGSREARRSTTSSRPGSHNEGCWDSTTRTRTIARSSTSRRLSWPRSCRLARPVAESVRRCGARP